MGESTRNGVRQNLWGIVWHCTSNPNTHSFNIKCTFDSNVNWKRFNDAFQIVRLKLSQRFGCFIYSWPPRLTTSSFYNSLCVLLWNWAERKKKKYKNKQNKRNVSLVRQASVGWKHIQRVTILKQYFKLCFTKRKNKFLKVANTTYMRQVEGQSVKLTVTVCCWCQMWLVQSLAIHFMIHRQRCATLVIMLLIQPSNHTTRLKEIDHPFSQNTWDGQYWLQTNDKTKY